MWVNRKQILRAFPKLVTMRENLLPSKKELIASFFWVDKYSASLAILGTLWTLDSKVYRPTQLS